MKRVLRGVGVVCSLAGLSACVESITPESEYLLFRDALVRKQPKKAWSMLSSPTQRALRERSAAIANVSPKAFKDAPEQLVFQGYRPRDISSLKILSADAETALLEVTSTIDTTHVKLLKEGEHWRVDFSDTLSPPARQ